MTQDDRNTRVLFLAIASLALVAATVLYLGYKKCSCDPCECVTCECVE